MKVTISGPTGAVLSGETYEFMVKIEPGDSWTNEASGSGDPTKILGFGVSQLLFLYDAGDVVVGDPTLKVDGSTIAEEYVDGIISLLFMGTPSGVGDVVAGAITELLASAAVHSLFSNTEPTGHIDFVTPSDFEGSSNWAEIRTVIGGSGLFDVAFLDSLEFSVPVTFNKAGSHTLTVIPDLRGEVHVIPASPITSDFFTGFEFRREILLSIVVAEPSTSGGNLVWSYEVGPAPPGYDTEWSLLVGDGILYTVGSMEGEAYIYALDAFTGNSVWRSQLNAFHLPPVIQNGVLYAVAGRDYPADVYALDATTGEVRWHYPKIDDYNGLTVEHNIVFIGENCADPGCTYGYIALDASSGEVLWHYESGDYPGFLPVVADGILYGGIRDEAIFALDEYTGELLWTYEVDLTGSPHGWMREVPPQLSNGTLYVTSEDGYVYALDAFTGRSRWRYFADGYDNYLTVEGGRVYVAGSEAYVALDASSGEVLWRYEGEREAAFPAVVSAAVVYVGSWDGYLDAIDAPTGRLLWRYSVEMNAAPAVRNEVVYAVSNDGSLYALDAASGELLWRYDTHSSINFSPIATGQMVYIRSGGYVYATGASGATPSEGGGVKQYSAPPAMVIDVDKQYIATIKTNMGDIVVELFPQDAPMTVNNFVFLARDDYYDGVIFHRVIPGFVIQGGDPSGTGAGGPGYNFADEIVPGLVFDRPGYLAMANRGGGTNTNGSQFFITTASTPHLNGNHTIFGTVVEGQDVVEAISRVPRGPQDRPLDPMVIRTIAIQEE